MRYRHSSLCQVRTLNAAGVAPEISCQTSGLLERPTDRMKICLFDERNGSCVHGGGDVQRVDI